MLVPVIGLVQVGSQARADRYTYLPQIGIAILASWTAADLAGRTRRGRAIASAVAGCALALLMACAFVQVSRWRTKALLWQQAVEHTSDNSLAHLMLAGSLREE